MAQLIHLLNHPVVRQYLKVPIRFRFFISNAFTAADICVMN